jgi:hypothetical protein
MFLLHLLPLGLIEFVVNAMLVLGITLTILGFFVINKLLLAFPPLAGYYKAVQVAGIALLVVGVYFKGGYSVEQDWRDRAAKLEEKVKTLEQASSNVTTQVEERVVTKVKVIKEKGKTIYVDRPAVVDYEKKCPLPREVIDIHNEAVDMNLFVEQQQRGAKK